MGAPESFLALELAFQLRLYLQQHNIGYLLGADGMIELAPRLVREPDVCFVSWSKTPDGKVLRDAISDCIPDLAVEILSPSNTAKEMTRKLREYFRAGVRLVWLIDPETQTAEAYSSEMTCALIPANGRLDGGEVLPGFTLPLAKLFERLARHDSKKPRKKK